MSDLPMTTAITILDPKVSIDRVNALGLIVKTLYKDVLTKDLDYGVIPGTGTKPTLLLPGMEKLMRALNAVPRYLEKRVIVDYDKPLFHYEYECQLIDADTGQFLPGGIGLGLCTSMESSFRFRTAERTCPTCGEPLRKSKGKPEYYCWQKTGGCGATFNVNDPEVANQEVGKIENPNIFDQVNAIMKRAKKRALGDAIKGAAAVSELFTVDLEDFVDGDFVEIDEPPKPPAQPKSEPTPPAQKTNSSELDIPRLIEAATPMYDAAKHAANSVNKLLADGILHKTDDPYSAMQAVVLHRAESVYKMDFAAVLEAIQSVNEDETISDYRTAFNKVGSHLRIWENIVEYAKLRQTPPAKAKSEAEKFMDDHNLTDDPFAGDADLSANVPPVDATDEIPF